MENTGIAVEVIEQVVANKLSSKHATGIGRSPTNVDELFYIIYVLETCLCGLDSINTIPWRSDSTMKEAILSKFAISEREWTSYIPPRAPLIYVPVLPV